jgi:multidrug efflux pump subunit AcrA (membrane-fusion protein)
MFARARIHTGLSGSPVVVPTSAVQQVDDLQVAFIEIEPDLFEARPLTLGHRDAGGVVVLTGVEEGEAVVVASGNAVKSQLLLSRLGAGCVDD